MNFRRIFRIFGEFSEISEFSENFRNFRRIFRFFGEFSAEKDKIKAYRRHIEILDMGGLIRYTLLYAKSPIYRHSINVRYDKLILGPVSVTGHSFQYWLYVPCTLCLDAVERSAWYAQQGNEGTRITRCDLAELFQGLCRIRVPFLWGIA